MEINVPELGIVEFEDGTPQHVIDGAISNHFASQLQQPLSSLQRSGPLSTTAGGPPLSMPSGALRSTLGEVGEALGTAFGEDAIKPSVDIPKFSPEQLRTLPDVNILGINPAIAGGMWNSAARGMEGGSTPLGVATAPLLAAKPLQPLIGGLLAGLGAKSSGEMLGAVSGTPGLSTGERTEGLSDAAQMLLGSVGPMHEFNPVGKRRTLTPAIKAFNIENPSEIKTFTGATHALANDAAVKEEFMPTGRDQGFEDENKIWRSRQESLPIFDELTGGKVKPRNKAGLMSEDLRDAKLLEHLKEAGKPKSDFDKYQEVADKLAKGTPEERFAAYSSGEMDKLKNKHGGKPPPEFSKNMPNVPEGMMRVYHGEGGVSGGGTGGAWGSTDPSRASSFGDKGSYVDIPIAEVNAAKARAKAGGSGTASDVVLSNEHIKQLKPIALKPKSHDLDIQGMRPGVLTIDQEKLIGKKGQVHDDIIAANQLKGKDIDRRIFVDKNGNELSREGAAQATGIQTETQPGRLHASELADEQDRLREELFKKYYGIE